MEKKKPSCRLLAAWGIYVFCFLITWVLICFFLPQSWHLPFLLIGGAVTLFLCIYLPLRYKNIAYAAHTDHLIVWGGVFFRSQKHIPKTSIRYTTIIYGVAERLCGVCTLILFVNGGTVLLEGLAKETAKTVQRQFSAGVQP